MINELKECNFEPINRSTEVLSKSVKLSEKLRTFSAAPSMIKNIE
jgi:hypothetical protein